LRERPGETDTRLVLGPRVVVPLELRADGQLELVGQRDPILQKRAVGLIGSARRLERRERRALDVVARRARRDAPEQIVPAERAQVALEVEIERIAFFAIR